MRRLKSLYLTLLKSGFKKEAAAILKLSRDNDIYYSAIINKVLMASPPTQEEINLSNAIVSQHKIDLSPKNILSGLF
jgi:hypothetical protein